MLVSPVPTAVSLCNFPVLFGDFFSPPESVVLGIVFPRVSTGTVINAYAFEVSGFEPREQLLLNVCGFFKYYIEYSHTGERVVTEARA